MTGNLNKSFCFRYVGKFRIRDNFLIRSRNLYKLLWILLCFLVLKITPEQGGNIIYFPLEYIE